jgi:Flp pilus assembly protein TadD
MNWDRHCRLRAASALLLAVAMMAGCTSAPGPDSDAADVAEQKQQAFEAELRRDFSEAVALLRGGDTENARDQFESLHQSHPERTGPLANLGIIAMDEGDTVAAGRYFTQVLELDPRHSVALTHLGVIARERGEFEQAENFYRQALEADRNHVPAMVNLAILLDIYLGRLEEALPLYEQYQSAAEEPTPRLKDWIFDVRNRL